MRSEPARLRSSSSKAVGLSHHLTHSQTSGDGGWSPLMVPWAGTVPGRHLLAVSPPSRAGERGWPSLLLSRDPLGYRFGRPSGAPACPARTNAVTGKPPAAAVTPPTVPLRPLTGGEPRSIRRRPH